MRIATWNVNSVKQRIDNLTAWLSERQPDIVCLQETKCVDEAFPREPLEALGYNVAVHGQKAFNGVALLSKLPVRRGHVAFARRPGRRPCPLHRGGGLGQDRRDARRVDSICPTATPPIRKNIHTKSNGWIDLFSTFSERLEPRNRWSWPATLTSSRAKRTSTTRRPGRGDALFLPHTREKFNTLCNLGLTDALRTSTDAGGLFTFWDYQAGAWQKNNGIRIDHLLLSPQAADRFVAVGIDKHVRAWEKPSDHVPVWADFDV